MKIFKKKVSNDLVTMKFSIGNIITEARKKDDDSRVLMYSRDNPEEHLTFDTIVETYGEVVKEDIFRTLGLFRGFNYLVTVCERLLLEETRQQCKITMTKDMKLKISFFGGYVMINPNDIFIADETYSLIKKVDYIGYYVDLSYLVSKITSCILNNKYDFDNLLISKTNKNSHLELIR